ncbi:NAD-dependent epimerase/dehydratase family protein [Candidatus Sumerlaeota bacterium]|nr:NAD-dependent epimerase/dehydratase family protein [Candidatus Sumerlaeota bacterium]
MRILVTGAGGFLGGAITRRLVERGDTVVALQRKRYDALERLGVEQIQADLTDAEAVVRAVQGCDAVMHCAAKAGVWGEWGEYYNVNVLGTQNVLNACIKAHVPRLVYTSTPSVTFAGQDQEGVDETTPIPRDFLSFYAKSKAQAEREVLLANMREGFNTVALRPHLIWGPGDPHLIPRLIQRARAGKLRLVRAPDKRIDACYIDNAADAHILALDELGRENSACAGNAYFIANGEPMPMVQLVNGILKAAGVDPVKKFMPAWLAWQLGRFFEFYYGMVEREEEPPITRFVARQLGASHWFDLTAARRDLEYTPKIKTEQGLELLRESFEAERKKVLEAYRRQENAAR